MTPTNNPNKYVCIKEDKIAELDAEITIKQKRLDDIDNKVEKMDRKLDQIAKDVQQLTLKSVQDDNNLNQRVTALESKQETLYRLMLVIPTILAILGAISVYFK